MLMSLEVTVREAVGGTTCGCHTVFASHMYYMEENTRGVTGAIEKNGTRIPEGKERNATRTPETMDNQHSNDSRSKPMNQFTMFMAILVMIKILEEQQGGFRDPVKCILARLGVTNQDLHQRQQLELRTWCIQSMACECNN